MEFLSTTNHAEFVTEAIEPSISSRLENISNGTTICPVDEVPSISVYLSAVTVLSDPDLYLVKDNNSTTNGSSPNKEVWSYEPRISGYGITLFTLGGVAVVIVLIACIDTVIYIMKYSPARIKAHSSFVVGIYPVIAIATYCAIVVPRAHLLAEAVTQGIFMAGMYQLFCLLVAYCGGETELIRKVKPNSLNMKVGPCCCWPCCCLPELQLDKKKVKILRILVLQLPVVQGLVYMALLVMWAERESLYEVNYMYFQPIIVVSILSGMWGMSMTIKMLRDILKEHYIFAKFIVMQLILLFAKLQTLMTKSFIWSDLFPCTSPLTPTVCANLIYNTLMLIEMIMLALIARKLYKRELPDIVDNNNDVEKVCVVSTHIATIENIMRGTIKYLPSSPTATRA